MPLMLPTVDVLDRDHYFSPEEFLALPDAQWLELVDGKLVEKNVSQLSARTEATFAAVFAQFLRTRPQLGQCYTSTLAYRCFADNPKKIRRPDITLISALRLNQLPDRDNGVMPIVPDLAIEVISKNDTVYEVRDKVKEYRMAGFPLIWLAEPETIEITVYALDMTPIILSANDAVELPELLPGLVAKVSDFFPIEI